MEPWTWLLGIGIALYYVAQIIIMPNGLLIRGPLAYTDFLNVITAVGSALVWVSGYLFNEGTLLCIFVGIAVGLSGLFLFLAGFNGMINEGQRKSLAKQGSVGFGWFFQIIAVITFFLSGYF